MNSNSGFTLTEIIVAMLITTITFAGIFFAFMSLGKMNVVSRVSQSQVSLTDSILESFYDTKYSEINENMEFTIPSTFTWNKDADGALTYLTTGDGYIFKLDNIEGSASTYSADITVTKKKVDNEGFKGFSNFDALGEKGTRIIDTVGSATAETTYDELAIDEFKLRSDSYIDAINREIKDTAVAESGGKEVDENELHLLKKFTRDEIQKNTNGVVNLSFRSDNKNFILTAIMQYTLTDASKYLGKSLDNTISYNIYNSERIQDLTNLFIFTGDRTCGSFKINIENGTDINNSVKCNLFLIKLDEDLDKDGLFAINNGIYTDIMCIPTNTKYVFNYSQTNPDITLTKLFTNLQNISTIDPQIYGVVDLQDRVYNVDITIKEKATGTFERASETVLVLDYDKK